MSAPEKRVLAQDRPQYEQSVKAKRIAQVKKEQADYEVALKQYESDVAQYEQEKQAAEAQYQKDLAEYKKYQDKIDQKNSIQKQYEDRISELESQKQNEINSMKTYKMVSTIKNGEKVSVKKALSNEEKKAKKNAISRKYNDIIDNTKKEMRGKLGSASFSIAYPGQPVPREVQKKYESAIASGEGVTLTQIYKQYQQNKQATLQAKRQTSIQQAQSAAIQQRESYSLMGQVGSSYGLQEGAERAGAIKPTQMPSNTIFPEMPMQAQKTSPPMINVKTGEYIYGKFVENNPRALVAGLRKPVPAEGSVKEQPQKPIFGFQNITEVKEPSALALLEFQSQLKTRTAPSQTVYVGILEERGLPLTPLSRRIIEVYSSKPIKEYKTRAEAFGLEEAKGKKGIISSPLGAKLFDMGTGEGSVRIGKILGYKYGKPILVNNLGVGVQGPPEGEPVLTPFGNLQFMVETGQLSPNPKSPQYKPQFQGPQRPKELSSSGERFEVILSALEKEQKRAAKFNDDVGELYHFGLEGVKDTIAGAAYIENLLWEGEAFVRRGERKTRDILIPPTSTSVAIESGITTRTPQGVYLALKGYEGQYGKGSVAGGFASLLIPLPTGKVSLPEKISSPLTKASQKAIPRVVKNKIAEIKESIKFGKKQRLAEEYASSRSIEGVFGIRREGKNIYIIERGLEEQRPNIPSIPATSRIIGFTQYVKGVQPKPIYSKTVIEKIPTVGKPSKVPMTVIEFGKKKTTITDFTAPSDVKVPPTEPTIISFTKEKPKAPLIPTYSIDENVMIISPDMEFRRTAKTLGLKQSSQFVYEKVFPSRKTMTEIALKEKEQQINIVAIGRSAPYEIVKIGKPSNVKSVLGKIKGILIPKKKETTDIFDYIGSKSRVTRVFETSGMGLGKSEFVKEVTKKGELIPVGSKDMTRALERAGLGEKRQIIKPLTPFDTTQFKVSKGTAGSSGRGRQLSEDVKENIIKSYTSKSVPKTTDYLSAPSRYVKPVSLEEPKIRSDVDIEYTTPRYPETKILPISIPISLSREKIMSLSMTTQVPKIREDEMMKLDTSQITKQKTETLQRQKEKLDMGRVTKQKLRGRQITRPRQVIILTPVLKAPVTERQQLKQPQLQKVQQKTLQVLKFKYVPYKPSRETEGPRRRPIPVFPKETKIPKSVLKKQKERVDFLGASSELQISGVFKRQDITYGQKKIARLLKGDVRVVQGKKRTVRRSKERKDLLGFPKKKKSRFW